MPFRISHEKISEDLIFEISYNLESSVSNKSRNGSWDIGSRDEGHDCDHSKTSVVKLSILLLSQSISIYSREVNWREDHGRKRTSLGVVNWLGFGDQFSNEDGEKNLSLSGVWNSIPSFKWLHSRKGLEGDIIGKHSREMVSSTLDNVSSGGKHSNTAVLKFSCTEPSKSFIRSKNGKTKRIE